jgi:putative ABC transport system ATP-binding protein
MMVPTPSTHADDALRPGQPTLDEVIHASGVRFGWRGPEPAVLDIPELAVRPGGTLFVAGPSGSGKTTLLSLLAGVVTPQSGEITLLGRRVDRMSGAERDGFRADHVGYIFQQFNLVPYLSVEDNVTLPLRFSARRREAAGGSTCTSEARRLLGRLGLHGDELLQREVTELSVGQQQRVAAARALIGAPEILLADEPTSSLDAANREAFLELLFAECRQAGTTVVLASHDRSMAGRFDQVFEVTRGAPS